MTILDRPARGYRRPHLPPIMKRLLVVAVLAIPLGSAVVRAADNSTAKAVVPAGFSALINGRDLTGWQEVEKAAEHWKIENGELINDGKGTDLATAKSYRPAFGYDFWPISRKATGDSQRAAGGVALPAAERLSRMGKASRRQRRVS